MATSDAQPTALTGIGVSPGLVAGPVARMAPGIPEPAIETLPAGTDLDAECDRIAAAAQTVKKSLELSAAEAKGDGRTLLETTAQMAADPTLTTSAQAKVRERRLVPARAVWEAAGTLEVRAVAAYAGPVRHMVLGWKNGAREDLTGFMDETGIRAGRSPLDVITAASEVMAVLCLAADLTDLKARLGRMVIAYGHDGRPVTAHDIGADGAMAVLLKDALKPNLVQTLEHNPVLVHGGPFANIAHGCNSLIATTTAMRVADFAVTEAGFGADLGAEKFLDIACRAADLAPSAVVIVATVRALKYNGGVARAELGREDLEALERGMPNLLRHLSNIRDVFGLPCVVAVNAFPTDTRSELDLVTESCRRLGVSAVLFEGWAKGGEGGETLAREIVRLCEEPSELHHPYELDEGIEGKLNAVATKVYRADGIDLTPAAARQLRQLEEQGFGGLPVCVAKTPYSFSDDQTKLGAPKGFRITVRGLRVSAGAGFIVALTGGVMTMPGLPKVPAAEGMDVAADGSVVGLF